MCVKRKLTVTANLVKELATDFRILIHGNPAYIDNDIEKAYLCAIDDLVGVQKKYLPQDNDNTEVIVGDLFGGGGHPTETITISDSRFIDLFCALAENGDSDNLRFVSFYNDFVHFWAKRMEMHNPNYALLADEINQRINMMQIEHGDTKTKGTFRIFEAQKAFEFNGQRFSVSSKDVRFKLTQSQWLFVKLLNDEGDNTLPPGLLKARLRKETGQKYRDLTQVWTNTSKKFNERRSLRGSLVVFNPKTKKWELKTT